MSETSTGISSFIPGEPISNYTSEIDSDTQSIISLPPFVLIDGVLNARDIGGYGSQSISQAKPDAPALEVRKGVLYRSAETSGITDAGKKALKELKVTAVFDLRSKYEIDWYKTTVPPINDVEYVWLGLPGHTDYHARSLADRLNKFQEDENGAFIDLYAKILEQFGQAYETILRHIKDHPNEARLVHCTAGKDRTGIFIALVLMLIGVSDEDVADEYALTTAGLKPLLPKLLQRSLSSDGRYSHLRQGAINITNSKKETMISTIGLIREHYGSAEGYFLKNTKLQKQDLQEVREVMLGLIGQ